MNGTSFSQTLAIALTPPNTTKAVSTQINKAMTILLMLKLLAITSTIAFDCEEQPIPKAPKAQHQAKILPINGLLRCSKAVIAPPKYVPSSSLRRYLTAIKDSAYFVAIPKIPPIQVHKTAPGPPTATAVPTPMMLPVPIVELKAVISEPKIERSPFCDPSPLNDSLIPLKTLF